MYKRLNDVSIGVKLNLIITVAVSVIAIILLAIQIYITLRLVNEFGQVRVEQEIQVIGEELVRVQEDMQTAATVLVNVPGLIEAVANEDIDAIERLSLGAVPSLNIDDFDIINSEGERLIDTEEELSDDEEGEDELIGQALLGIQRSTILLEEEDDEVSLLFVSIRPLRDENATIVGGLLLARELNHELLTALNYGRNGIDLSLIYDNDVLASSFSEDSSAFIDNIQFNGDSITQTLAGVSSDTPEFTLINRIIYVSTYVPVQGLDDRSATAVVQIRINNRELNLFLRRLIIGTIIVAIALVSALVFIILYRIRFLIVRRLRRLQETIAEIAEGNYDKRVTDETSKDEIGQLANDFNRMAGEIQSHENELQELNQSLENRVAERTLELKKARDEAVAAQRLANENSRLKSEFLSTMSHELRTPMNAIEGFTGIMLNNMGGVEYNDKAERYLKKVQSNSRRLLALINDFLDLSRIESGRMELVSLPMTPSMMANKWEDNLSVLAQEKGIGFEVTVDPTLPETIYGDEEALTKVAINLIGNAVKFTSEGSVTLSLEKREENMAMVVKDTGIGIPPHAREFIFDEFRQVDQSSKREYGGTGLGLSIVQKLVREMGGTVSLDSEVGAGSTFTVLIPIHTEEKQIA